MVWDNPQCPKCDKTNWIDLGDLDDLTVDDIDVVQCWKCNHKFLLSPEAIDSLKMYYQVKTEKEIIEIARCEKGGKRPREY